MNYHQLLILWLEENRDQCRLRAARAERAYRKSPLLQAALTLVRAHFDAAMVYQNALTALAADPPPAEPPAKDPSP